MKRFTLAVCAILLQAVTLSAQTEKIARLRRQEAAATNDYGRLDVQLHLLDEHESLFKDSLAPVAMRCLALAQSLHDIPATGYATLGLINAQLRQDNPRAADSIIATSLPGYPLSNTRLADVHLRLRLAQAGLLAVKADYEGAVKGLLAIIRDAEKAGDNAVLSRAFNELGVISYNRNELPQALEYYGKALSYNDRNPQADQARAYAYINIAMVNAWQEHYDTALRYLSLAKPICDRLENLYYLANAYAVEVNAYKWSGHLPQAEAAMLRMVALRERTGRQPNLLQ